MHNANIADVDLRVIVDPTNGLRKMLTIV